MQEESAVKGWKEGKDEEQQHGRAHTPLRSDLSDSPWSCQVRGRAPQEHSTRWMQAEQMLELTYLALGPFSLSSCMAPTAHRRMRFVLLPLTSLLHQHTSTPGRQMEAPVDTHPWINPTALSHRLTGQDTRCSHSPEVAPQPTQL